MHGENEPSKNEKFYDGWDLQKKRLHAKETKLNFKLVFKGENIHYYGRWKEIRNLDIFMEEYIYTTFMEGNLNKGMLFFII